ncbi:MAG TPA: ELWxxDGT repeat protein, partial [Thermoanaerobaculia bacterium]|nr:ELWxxDGT repeat protein [Thermoanaerobaculia bacterium]
MRASAVFVVGMALSASASAQTGLPGLLRDIATPPQAAFAPLLANPVALVPLAGEVYFAAWDPTAGLELRATDGTAAGTRTVRDVCPGSCHGFWISELVASAGALYFVGDDGVHGRELWRSDGTASGTMMLTDIAPGLDISSDPRFLTPTPAGLFFTARDADHGRELWLTDGTAGGTHRVADVTPGNGEPGDAPVPLGWLDTHGLVFAVDDGIHGYELWITQGDAASTALLADTQPGPIGGVTRFQPFPGRTPEFAALGGRLFLSADDGVHGVELWSTDGTAAGTALVADLVAGSAPSTPDAFHPFGAAVLFRAGNPGLDTTLWRSDGTPGGTFPLGDAAHGSDELVPSAYAELGGLVYFPGYQTATGRELWRTDGTLAGTQLAVDIVPGPGYGVQTFHYFVAAAGRLWFRPGALLGLGSRPRLGVASGRAGSGGSHGGAGGRRAPRLAVLLHAVEL